MKKIVFAIGVVLVLAGIASPFISGVIMERIVRDSFDNLNQRYAESGQDVRAEIVRYDKGFSSSEIEWRIKSDSLKAMRDVDEVVFIDRAEHNLSGITTRTSLEKNAWYADLINNRLGGKDPLHITTTYKMTGGIETTAAIDAFTVQDGQESVAVRPGRVAVALDREFKSFSADGTWEGLEVPGKLALAGLSLKANFTMISPYVWDGEAHMAVQNGKANGASEANPFELVGLKVDSVVDFDQERKTLSATGEYRADSLTAGADKIDNIFAGLDLKGLDVGRYTEFMKLYTATMRGFVNEMAAARNEPQKMKEIADRQMANMGFQLVAAGEKLLTRGLEFQLTGLHLQLPEGEMKGSGVLMLKKDLTFALVLPMVNQPKLALDVFDLKSALSLPEKLVGDAPMLLSPVYPGMQTGLFVKNGDLVRHTAETRDNKLFLNDKEVLWQ